MFKWATALGFEKADSVITHLLEIMAIMEIPEQIKPDNAFTCVFTEMKQFFFIIIWSMLLYTTQTHRTPVIEIANHNLKEMPIKQKERVNTKRYRLSNALLTQFS